MRPAGVAWGCARVACGDAEGCTLQVVGDLAQFMVQNELSEEELVEKAESLDFPSRCARAAPHATAVLIIATDGSKLL